MKKAGRVLVPLLIIAALLLGAGYGAFRFASVRRTPVNVVQVSSVDIAAEYAMWDIDITDPEYGTITARNTQTVELDSDLILEKVYVKEGDNVKKGDLLLEYDMTGKELEREMEDLLKQSQEINLRILERELAQLRAKRPSLYVSIDEQLERSTAEDEIIGLDDLFDDNMDGADQDDVEDPFASGADDMDDPFAGEDSSGQIGEIITYENDDSGLLVEYDEEQGDDTLSGEEGSVDLTDLIALEGADLIVDEEDPSEDDIFGEERLEDNTDVSISAALIRDGMLDFMSGINRLTTQYSENRYSVSSTELARMLSRFRGSLALKEEGSSFLDALGHYRKSYIYRISDQALEALQELERRYPGTFNAAEAIRSLHLGYGRALLYNMINKMQALNEAGTDPSGMSSAQLERFRSILQEALDAYYEFYYYWKYLKNEIPEIAEEDPMFSELSQAYLYEYESELKLASLGDAYDGRSIEDDPYLGYSDSLLSDWIKEFNQQDLITIPSEEIETETDEPGFDDGFDDGYGDDAESDEDLKTDYFSKVMEIRAVRLEIREAAIKIRELDAELAKGTVTALMDGVVISAGTLDGGTTEESFIVISGEAGMYVRGTVGELERDTIKIGDVLHGTSTETGGSFTAVVTEISDYPLADGEDMFYGYSFSAKNENVSRYAYYAYIEDASDVAEGECEILFEKVQEDAGICLESYFVRTDSAGRNYVLVRGADEKLQTRYVKISSSPFGYGLQIKSGLSTDDYIAFPYGKNVQEGALTVIVDSLDLYLYG